MFRFLSRKGPRFIKQHLTTMQEATPDDQTSDHSDEDDDFFVKKRDNPTAVTQLDEYRPIPSTETMTVAALSLIKRLFFETNTPLPGKRCMRALVQCSLAYLFSELKVAGHVHVREFSYLFYIFDY